MAGQTERRAKTMKECQQVTIMNYYESKMPLDYLPAVVDRVIELQAKKTKQKRRWNTQA